ncbi:MAG: pilus assembly protein PilF [Burkholderiaceae bacterium]
MSLRLAWLRLQARGLLLLGKADAARDRFAALLRLSPDDRHALASCAFLLARDGDKAAAIGVLRDMVLRHPQHASGWFNLAYLLDEVRQDAHAEVAFRQAIAVNAAMDRAWYGLGLLLIRNGRLDEAAVALRRNTELQPMSPFGWYQLARVEMDRQHAVEARRILQHLRGFEPKVAAQLARELNMPASVIG